MSSTYLKFLSRNKLYTFIEVFGLSVALGFVILMASYARTEFSVGAKQPLSEQLYVVGAGDSFGMTLGTSEEFFPSIPEIKGWTRICDGGDQEVMVGEDYYKACGAYLDTNFFDYFDYRLVGCSKERVLENEDEVILSKSFAKKVFGNEDPIGRTLSIDKDRLTVVGVVEDFGPEDVFQHYDLFASIKCAQKLFQWMDNFGNTIPIVLLDEGTDVDKVRQELLDKYIDYWNFYKDDSDNAFFWGSSLTRLDKVYFSDFKYRNCLRDGDRKQVELLFIVALVLLVSAIFNYINLSVAQTGKRAKEMATRRLLGENSRNIVARYVTESFVFTAGCFVVGALLAYSFKPMFDRFLSTDIVLTPDVVTVLWVVLALIVISGVSALLPALIVSRFKPIDVVKGEFRFKSKMLLGKVFIVFQGVFSTVLVAMAIAMTAQVNHLVNLPTGYDTKDIIQVDAYKIGYNRGSQMPLHDKLKALPQVTDAGTGITSPVACGANGIHDETGDKLIGWMRMAQLDTTSLRILGFKLLEKYSELSSPKVLLTETSKRDLGVTAEHPFAGGSYTKGEYEICGVVPDFRANSALFEPMEKERNSIRIIDDNYPYSCIHLLKITGDRNEAISAVKNTCREFFRETFGIPSELPVYYLDDKLVDDLKGTKNTMLLVISFMIMAILISALGLFAMSLYFTEQQSRQIAVRKVFGAEVSSAVWSLSKSFMIMSAVAVVLATPLAVWGITYYLQGFYTKISFPWWAIVLAALISLLVSFLSVVGQTYAAATENPVKTLSQD